MMILQGVRREKPYIGVCYANDPKKGGYTTLAPALDLTTSLRGDLHGYLQLLTHSFGAQHHSLGGTGYSVVGVHAPAVGW